RSAAPRAPPGSRAAAAPALAAHRPCSPPIVTEQPRQSALRTADASAVGDADHTGVLLVHKVFTAFCVPQRRDVTAPPRPERPPHHLTGRHVGATVPPHGDTSAHTPRVSADHLRRRPHRGAAGRL